MCQAEGMQGRQPQCQGGPFTWGQWGPWRAAGRGGNQSEPCFWRVPPGCLGTEQSGKVWGHRTSVPPCLHSPFHGDQPRSSFVSTPPALCVHSNRQPTRSPGNPGAQRLPATPSPPFQSPGQPLAGKSSCCLSLVPPSAGAGPGHPPTQSISSSGSGTPSAQHKCTAMIKPRKQGNPPGLPLLRGWEEQRKKRNHGCNIPAAGFRLLFHSHPATALSDYLPFSSPETHSHLSQITQPELNAQRKSAFLARLSELTRPLSRGPEPTGLGTCSLGWGVEGHPGLGGGRDGGSVEAACHAPPAPSGPRFLP